MVLAKPLVSGGSLRPGSRVVAEVALGIQFPCWRSGRLAKLPSIRLARRYSISDSVDAPGSRRSDPAES